MAPRLSTEVDGSRLRRCLERVLPNIVHIDQARAACATSHPCNQLTVRLGDGREVKLFLKEFAARAWSGGQDQEQEGPLRRAERERTVYRHLLAGAGLGTARYYGAFVDEGQRRLVLVLEFVDGVRLRGCPLDAWVAAARWLGRMQAYGARHPEHWPASNVLLRHDANFFQARAQGAARAVSQVAPHLAGRLAGVLKDYGRLVDVMARQPRTVVHGSYRPQNVVVNAVTRRVCPVDWERAALGAPLYDLAFVSDGFRPPDRDRLWDAYLGAAGDARRPARDREEMRYLVDCFRLHKVLKSLSEANDKNFPEATVAKLVGQAEELGRLRTG
jgi:phosphotransferase family enzyme